MTTRVLLVRHGRTALNAAGRLRGLANPELDEVGVGQASAAALALRPFGLDRVLSSPLHRAVHTATIIADVSGVPHSVDEAFNDRDYGPWTGHLKDEVVEQWGSVDAAPGVEAVEVVMARVMPALDALAAEVDATVAVVTHDAVIGPILSAVQPGIDPTIDNGAWAVLARDGEGWIVESRSAL
ncbi:MAG: fructose-2,6-bisphosphatase [Schumannella sp.]|nr:fructose-2,6-bisphosphatase [Schumannella sp.]